MLQVRIFALDRVLGLIDPKQLSKIFLYVTRVEIVDKKCIRIVNRVMKLNHLVFDEVRAVMFPVGRNVMNQSFFFWSIE